MGMCAVLDHMVEQGYFESGFVLDRETGKVNKQMILLSGSGTGRKRKPPVFFKFCPFCGGPQKLDGPFMERGPQCVGIAALTAP